MARKTTTRMAEADRALWIDLLTAAATQSPNQLNDEWRWLLTELGLSAEFFPAVLLAVKQGRWRTADNPKHYVKRVARLEALKAKRAAEKSDELILVKSKPGDSSFSIDSALDQLSYAADTTDAIRDANGVWKRGGGREALYNEDDQEDERGNFIGSLRGRLLAKVPNSMKQWVEPPDWYKASVEDFNQSNNDWHIEATGTIRVDLKQWASLAGFNDWDTRVLDYRAQGVSRDSAMEDQPDEVSRKALQAAWRKFDRTGLARLRLAAEKELAEDVPE